MLTARDSEELVCPKGSAWGHLTGDANDQIIDGDFAAREFSASPPTQHYFCACGGQPVTVRELVRWRVDLRLDWGR